MKKVKAICIHKDNVIYNLTVQSKTGNTPLIWQKDNGDIYPYKYHFNSFHDMYKGILDTLKSNNMYVEKFKSFGSYIYDVSFINLDNPTRIDRFYFDE